MIKSHIIEEDTIVSTANAKRKLCFCGIYFLINKHKIVYVGKTKVGFSRIAQHIKDKEFDSFNYFECIEEELDSLETYYIIKFKPKYNKSANENLFSLNWLNTICKRIYGIKDLRKIKSIIKRYGFIPETNYNGLELYGKKERDIIIEKFGEE